MQKWQQEMADKRAARVRVDALAAALIVNKDACSLAAEAKKREWRPDERIARGSANTKTRKPHHFCGGGCGTPGAKGHEDCQRGCGTHSAAHCGGRRFAATTTITFCNDDASLRISVGMKRQARIKLRGF